MVAYPGFRGLVIVVVALIGGVIWYTVEQGNKKARLARSLIKPSEVELRDFTLGREYGSFKLTGNVKNLSSKYTLLEIIVAVRVYDCPTEKIGLDCEVIGERTERLSATTPPGQVRNFNKSVWFSNMPEINNFEWSYKIKSITASVN